MDEKDHTSPLAAAASGAANLQLRGSKHRQGLQGVEYRNEYTATELCRTLRYNIIARHSSNSPHGPQKVEWRGKRPRVRREHRSSWFNILDGVEGKDITSNKKNGSSAGERICNELVSNFVFNEVPVKCWHYVNSYSKIPPPPNLVFRCFSSDSHFFIIRWYQFPSDITTT